MPRSLIHLIRLDFAHLLTPFLILLPFSGRPMARGAGMTLGRLLTAGLLAIWSTGTEAFLHLPSHSLNTRQPLTRSFLQRLDSPQEEVRVAVKVATLRPPWELPSSSQSSTAPVVKDDGDSTFFDKIWRNCNTFTRSCLGNALDDPNYRAGVLASIGITLALSSQHPALHSLYTNIEHSPPVLLLNAAAAVAAAVGMAVGGNSLEALTPCKVGDGTTTPEGPSSPERRRRATIAGLELGFWITIASALNVAGLATTSASHGAFLIQLTTLMVPIAQGVMGVPIPKQIWAGVLLALGGLYLFTNDPTSAAQTSLDGDLLCVLSAVFFTAYDVRFFDWGKELGDKPVEMIQYKVVSQAVMSVLLVAGIWVWDMLNGGGQHEITTFFHSVTAMELLWIAPVVLYCGLIVNAAVSISQVGAVQALGASRSQIIYATGPLWSALMSMALLGEKAGPSSLAGGAVFLLAMLVGATAPPPENVCDEEGRCEL